MYLVTHPDVVIDPNVPVPEWPLSVRGRVRMQQVLAQEWLRRVESVYSSLERKARDGAEIVAAHLHKPYQAIAGLGEIDRSATGYLPHDEHMAVAAEFFAHPDQSIRGWERAVDAQQRIVSTIDRLLAHDHGQGDIIIVSHGGVALLYRCWLKQQAISDKEPPPHPNGGNYYCFDAQTKQLVHDWRVID
ncbi:MAG TPA: histidine phosphatase family protein, partial [Roseiflexaceae bacterium]|nr:histidine phosphatase family protein [Roseiflexaceae bacterium]